MNFPWNKNPLPYYDFESVSDTTTYLKKMGWEIDTQKTPLQVRRYGVPWIGNTTKHYACKFIEMIKKDRKEEEVREREVDQLQKVIKEENDRRTKNYLTGYDTIVHDVGKEIAEKTISIEDKKKDISFPEGFRKYVEPVLKVTLPVVSGTIASFSPSPINSGAGIASIASLTCMGTGKGLELIKSYKVRRLDEELEAFKKSKNKKAVEDGITNFETWYPHCVKGKEKENLEILVIPPEIQPIETILIER